MQLYRQGSGKAAGHTEPANIAFEEADTINAAEDFNSGDVAALKAKIAQAADSSQVTVREGHMPPSQTAEHQPIRSTRVRGISVQLMARNSARDKGQQATAQLPAIQRKVGFEFETGWEARIGDERLKKKDPVGTSAHEGFKIESDDDGRIEFIIHPPLDISKQTQQKLDSIFDVIEAYCRNLLAASRQNRRAIAQDEQTDTPSVEEEGQFAPSALNDSSGSDNEEEDGEYEYDPFPLNQATGLQGDAVYTIHPTPSGDIAANPQSTAGLTLEQIANLPKYDKEEPLPEIMGAAITSTPEDLVPKINTQALIKLGIEMSDLGDKISDDLKGLTTLAARYIITGDSGDFVYPKALTDPFLLARTNFVALFEQMPEKRYFKRHPDKWVALVLSIAGVRDGDAPVYVKGVAANDQHKSQNAPFGPSRQDWLWGMATGRDLMTNEQNARYESMGEFGTRTEMVATSQPNTLQNAGIFELRGGQTRSRDYREWRSYAKQVAKFLMNMQKDPNGLIGHMEKMTAMRKRLAMRKNPNANQATVSGSGQTS